MPVITSITNSNNIAKKSNKLLQNYPNPFNPITTISFDLLKTANCKLSIYNSRGQLVKKIMNKELKAGNHNIVWNGKNSNEETISSGVYFYKLEIDGKEVITKKMMLMK